MANRKTQDRIAVLLKIKANYYLVIIDLTEWHAYNIVIPFVVIAMKPIVVRPASTAKQSPSKKDRQIPLTEAQKAALNKVSVILESQATRLANPPRRDS